MKTPTIIRILLTLTCCVLLNGTATAADAIVVRPAQWADEIEAWKAYRSGQGIHIVEIDSRPDPQAIRESIREVASQGDVQFVVLMGDVNPLSPRHLPTFYQPSEAMVQFGGDATQATDNPYGDFDDDGIPDAAVGRIPADTSAQIKQVLDRVMAYEQQPDCTLWQRDVHVVAGVGGFGALADSVIEMTTRRFLSDRVPNWSKITMTHASTNSIYCPDPWQFQNACVDMLNQGGKFWVYIGHGHVRTLDYLRVKEEFLPIFNDQNLPEVACQHPPIALFLACYTGAFDATKDALAEELLLLEKGPIACIAASRVSGPYGLAMLSDGMLTNLYEEQLPTLGEVVLAAKRNMLTGKHGPQEPKVEIEPVGFGDQVQMINAIASAMSPKDYDLHQERREHVAMVHLLGDPLLRLTHPQNLDLQVAESAEPGETITVQGVSGFEGPLFVELVYRRDQTRRDLKALRGSPDSESGQEKMQLCYQAANQRSLASETVVAPAGKFALEFKIPSDVPRGRYIIRAFMPGDQSFQAGDAPIAIRPNRS